MTMNADKSIYMPWKNICELCIVYDDLWHHLIGKVSSQNPVRVFWWDLQ